jgi:hypothetical protein
MVGAIHGRLLTAWVTAGILGPVLVNYMRDCQLGLGIPREQVYNQTRYILVGMLVIGLICTLLVSPVAAKHFMSSSALAEEKRLAHERAMAEGMGQGTTRARTTNDGLVYAAWGGSGFSARLGRVPHRSERSQVLQLIACDEIRHP